MVVEQIYTGCLAEAAYYIESNGEAVVIDPLREPTPYLERAAKGGAKIKYVLETHFHADFVSGHLDLARKAGASIVYGPTAETGFDAHIATDGEVFKVGELTLTVLHTPGHTMESTTYLLKDKTGKDYAIFTGDTLFIGDVGRPDLAQKQGSLTQEDLAGMLFDSLRNKLMPLSDEVLVYPAHGAGSACGKNMSSETFSTLGDQKKSNYALRADMTKVEFVSEVTDGLLPPPNYFPKNVQLNKGGYDSFYDVMDRGLKALSPAEFEQLAAESGALILDTRNKTIFVKGFVPGAIFIGLDGSFAPWVGTLIQDIKQPILLVSEKGAEEESVRRLSRVGYDNCLGYLEDGIAAWEAAGKTVDQLEEVDPATYAKLYAAESIDTLDVRKPGEFDSAHVKGAENFPLDFINSKMEAVQPEKHYYLHCKSGYRSVIAASILRARGFRKLVNVTEGFNGMSQLPSLKASIVSPALQS